MSQDAESAPLTDAEAPKKTPLPPEAPKKPLTPKRAWRKVRHFVRRLFNRPLLALVVFVVPRLYTAYMWLVWKTSRVDEGDLEIPRRMLDQHDGFIGALWHEEVFSVAWAYRTLHGHTLASRGDAGRLITAMLKRCNFTVFRGGSSRKASRRATGVLSDMVEHKQQTRRVCYGLTVDGSAGPPYVFKHGATTIAARTGGPILLPRTWYKRFFRLPTWDGTVVPLPFNRVHVWFRGPYWPPSPDQTEALEAFRLQMERGLLELARDSFEEYGQQFPDALVARLEATRQNEAPPQVGAAAHSPTPTPGNSR